MKASGKLAGATAAVLMAGTAGLGLAANIPASFDPRHDPARAPGAIGAEPAPAGAPGVANPLWGVPLTSLNATRQRPIFLPSRRPPTPAVPAAVIKEQLPPAAEPDRPPLSLVGIVTGPTDGFAVFVSDTTRDIVRLRTGEGHEGWILRSVQRREAVLERNQRKTVIELPAPKGDGQ